MGAAVSHAHNGFIEAFFSLGFIGLTYSILLLRTLIASRDPGKYTAINYIFLSTIIVINTLEAQLLTFNVYIVVLLILTVQRRNEGLDKRQSATRLPNPNQQLYKPLRTDISHQKL